MKTNVTLPKILKAGRTWLLFVLILFVQKPALFAQISRTISYQGVLMDNSGNPKPDGDYTVVFSLYENETGGNPIWSETKTLAVTRGLFWTSLGDQTPFGSDVKFDIPYRLGIKVGDESELSPRIALTSSGYSLTSSTTLNVAEGLAVKSLNGLKDNITLEGSGGTTIGTDGNKITISVSGTGGTGIQEVKSTNNTLDISDPNGPTATVNLKLPLILDGVLNTPDYLITSNVTGTGGGIIGTSTNGFGIVGQSLGISGVNYGVAGNSKSPDGFAVSGWNLATTGNSVGVVGRTNSPTGIAIRGESNAGRGIYGVASGSGGSGVVGENFSLSGNNRGVWGVVHSGDGSGVLGQNVSQNPNAIGVLGIIESTDPGTNSVGVKGINNSTTGIGIGVWGKHNGSGSGLLGESNGGSGIVGSSNSGTGVYGLSNSYYGVYGFSSGGFGTAGVIGKNVNISPYGALGYYGSLYDYGVFGSDGGNDQQYAGGFSGSVRIQGNLEVTGDKNFKIDHPLDPENKYLLHSCVESPARMNIYNGNIVTDANGSATVELPEYFEALNVDYRYQLTVIGQFAQAIIESEIKNNHFTIRTDKPNVKVSWLVTGVRNDPYARTYPMVVEEQKEESAKGKYIMPELFGQPKEKGTNFVNEPEILKRKQLN